MVKIENLWKSFNGKPVLKGINLEVEEGKINVIMGRSGCGKTVLMKHIVGLLKPDKGKIFFEGVDITNLNEKDFMEYLKKIGFLFQNSALFDSITVEENIAFPLIEVDKEKDRRKIKEKVSWALSVVGLEGTEKKYPMELSGGMKKRVALARAIIRFPKLVIFDEPTSGIDPITSSSIEDLIVEVKEKLKITFIVITHDIKSAIKIADKIVIMKDGEIIWEGGKNEIIQRKDIEEIKFFLKRLEL